MRLGTVPLGTLLRNEKTALPTLYSVATTFASKLNSVAHFAALENSLPTCDTEQSTVMDFPLVMKYVNYRLVNISAVQVQ